VQRRPAPPGAVPSAPFPPRPRPGHGAAALPAAAEQHWRYRVVALPRDPGEATSQLNELDDMGWQYVGLINNAIGFVNFERLNTKGGSFLDSYQGHESWV